MLTARLAPLALALLIAPAAAPAQGGAQQIEVALSNFKFAPETIQLTPGKPYVLHLVNRANGGHNFEAKTFFAAANVAPADRAKVARGRIELDAGESVDIHLTAPGPGNFPVRCTHFLHAGFGMTGKIVVA
jgi:uncharacterized cupredoxin-like copper-binding protein